MKKIIYLAGGCFWGMQAYFKRLQGVIKTSCGYANGNCENTNYKIIKNTKHAETIKIEYDDFIINTAELIDRFFLLIDPFSKNKQGDDQGIQYRVAIFFEEKDLYTKTVAILFNNYYEKQNNKKTFVIIEPLKHYILAEEYHQDYLDKNKGGYCHIDLSLLNKPIYDFIKLPLHEIEKLSLTRKEYNVLINKDTEKPHTSSFNKFDETGLYIDKISGEPLFSSENKFDAGCGWPSFTKPLITSSVCYNDDYTIPNRYRVEVVSMVQDSHLGHVFNDGPSDRGGNRYCINGLCLNFIPLLKLENTKYEKYMFYFSSYVNKFLK